MDWQRATAVAQGQAILAGLISPVDQTEAYLDAAAAHPDGSRIYARLTEDRARAEAIAAHDRARAGRRRGMLDGVALSWKDNIDSAGTATEAGSRLLKGRVPAADAEVLAGATGSGLVCIGKTHMTELAFSGLGVNPVTATPPNALDPALAPGGSSSGAAVSVALALAAAAIGSDTGGSLRVPAAWNGIVGFKPTTGVVPMAGVVPLCRRFDAVGPMTRSVEDAAALFGMLTDTPPADLTGARASGLRLLVLAGVPFEEAVDHLARANVRITRGTLPLIAEAMALAPLVFAPEAYGIWKDHIEDGPEAMHPPVLARFRSGQDVSAPDYVAAWEALDRHRRAWRDAVALHDAVLLPTCPILPPDTSRLLADPDYFATENLLTLRNTRIANLLGLPAISLPTMRPACGIMIMGASGRDRHLLRIASAVEAVLGTASATA